MDLKARILADALVSLAQKAMDSEGVSLTSPLQLLTEVLAGQRPGYDLFNTQRLNAAELDRAAPTALEICLEFGIGTESFYYRYDHGNGEDPRIVDLTPIR